MKTENNKNGKNEFVESIVSEMYELFNEGYYDKMGDIEPYRHCFPEAKEKISRILVDFMNTISRSGAYTNRQIIAEARLMLRQIDEGLASGKFG